MNAGCVFPPTVTDPFAPCPNRCAVHHLRPSEPSTQGRPRPKRDVIRRSRRSNKIFAAHPTYFLANHRSKPLPPPHAHANPANLHRHHHLKIPSNAERMPRSYSISERLTADDYAGSGRVKPFRQHFSSKILTNLFNESDLQPRGM
jgi:hypothetical protein